MNTEQHNLKSAEPTQVVSRWLGFGRLVLASHQETVAQAAESIAYPPADRCVVVTDADGSERGIQRPGFMADHADCLRLA